MTPDLLNDLSKNVKLRLPSAVYQYLAMRTEFDIHAWKCSTARFEDKWRLAMRIMEGTVQKKDVIHVLMDGKRKDSYTRLTKFINLLRKIFFIFSFLKKKREVKDCKESRLLVVREAAEISWLRDQKEHQEDILYTRINYFIVVSSILIAAFARIQGVHFRLAIGFLGLFVSKIWFGIILRQRQIVDDLRDMLLASDNIYKQWRELRSYRDNNMEKKYKVEKVSGQKLMYRWSLYIFVFFWIIFLIISIVDYLMGAFLSNLIQGQLEKLPYYTKPS